MSATTQPEVINPPPNPSPSPSNPPTDVSKEITDLQMKVIADKDRENRELRAKLTRLEEAEKVKSQTPPAPTKTDEQINSEFFRTPAQAMRDVLQASIAPLAAKVDSAVRYVDEDRNRNTTASLKEQFRNDPRYKSKFATLEPVLDKMIELHVAEGKQVNFDVMHNAILSAIGLIASGQINGFSFDNAPAPPNREAPPSPAPRNDMPANNEPPRSVMTPPHLMPSNPPPPPAAKKQYRELSENERLLARQRGWSAEEYLDRVGEPNEKLVITDFGQRNKKKKEGK